MNLLTLVGLGPGGPGGLTADARAALEGADLFCGYTGYIDLIRPLWPATPCLSTPMTRELERCRLALEEAAGISIAEEDAANLKTVGDIMTYLAAHKN